MSMRVYLSAAKRQGLLPYAIAALTAISLAVIAIILINSAFASAESGDSRGALEMTDRQKMVTIYDEGRERTITTKANTVEEALKAARIDIASSDEVEPARQEAISSSHFTIDVRRSHPVVIEDGGVRRQVLTTQQNAKEIAKDANVELHDDDEATVSTSSDINSVLENGAAAVLKINRATQVEVTLYGKPKTMYTRAKTVGEFLKEKQIHLGKDDTLSVDEKTPITAQMKFEIWRNGKQTISEEKEVDFTTEQEKDPNKETSFKEVKTPGEKGKKTVTYEVEMRNGKEVSRKEIQSVVTKEPKKQIEIIGTKKASPSYSGGGSKSEWLAASGIAQSDWGYADWLVQKESGWNPNAVNKSSGACGLAQALPCSKVPGGGGHDPVSSLKWMDSYVKGRYGGWAGAVEHSKSKGWY